jgi:hypothetical protein
MDVDWKIQCVTFKYFDTIEELFKSFDINVCRIAYDGTNVTKIQLGYGTWTGRAGIF